MQPVQGGQETGVIDLFGRAVAWSAVGAGPPLLLVNGYAATAADWDPGFLAALADGSRGFEVICPDNRGMGESEIGDPGRLSIEAMAADLIELLDQRQIESCPVVGWSMGGFVAQALARLAPDRVEALALLATDAGGPSAVLADPVDWARLTDHSGSAREQASRIISLLFPPPVAEVIDRDFGELVAEARASLSERALTAQEEAIADWHASDPAPVGASGLPVLIACGSEDVVIPAANAELLAVAWPGAQVEVFDGGGHAFMAQEPAELADLIKSFLEK